MIQAVNVLATIAVPAEILHACSAEAWLVAMVDAERALAAAGAGAGVVPADAARAIVEGCRSVAPDWVEISNDARLTGNPAEPLARALREHVGGAAARFVHFGATSQDVVDTAAMLVAAGTRTLVLAELDRSVDEAARLARDHRSTLAVARTLLQPAVPTTFGLRAAGWLVALLDARERLREVSLPAQLGGAAGTLAAFGDRGIDVLRLFARELDLAEPALPWHATRAPVTRLAAGLAACAGALAKIGLDVALLSQAEVAELAEGDAGGSSTMPQKRNPTSSALARACTREALAATALLLANGEHELERAAGAWHAEWDALSRALAYTGGAAAAVADTLGGLVVDAERMAANVPESALTERLASLLAECLGRTEAHELLAAASASGRPLREALAGELDAAELDAALDPRTYLGSTDALVDRALALYEAER